MNSDEAKLPMRAAIAHASYLACNEGVDRSEFLKLARMYFDLIHDSEESEYALAVLARGRGVKVEDKRE